MNLKIQQATSKGYIEVKPHGAEWYRATTVTYHPPSCAKTKYMCMKESKIIDKVIQVANIVDDTNIGFNSVVTSA